MTDAEQIRKLLAGDAQGLQEVRRWIRGAASPYRELLANDLEDLEQEALCELLVALRAERFRGSSSLRTYVRRLVHHTCLDRLRAARVRQPVALDAIELSTPDEDSPGERLARQEDLRLALRVFAQLPVGCRELWRWILEGASYRAMSLRLGVSEGTLRVRVLRCRRRALELRDEFSVAST